VDINSSSCEPVTSGAPFKRRLLKRGAQESTHSASILPRGYYKLAETSEITVEATYETLISGDPQQSLQRVRAVHFIVPQPQRGGHESETRAQVSWIGHHAVHLWTPTGNGLLPSPVGAWNRWSVLFRWSYFRDAVQTATDLSPNVAHVTCRLYYRSRSSGASFRKWQ